MNCGEINFSVAVLGKDGEFILIKDGVSGGAGAIERGYTYCGFIGVVDGVAKVQCEPGLAAAFTMLRAGPAFAELFGPRLKQHQSELSNQA